MRKLALSLTLALIAAPALASGPGFFLPDLTFPTDQTITGSTKGCSLPVDPKEPAPATCN